VAAATGVAKGRKLDALIEIKLSVAFVNLGNMTIATARLLAHCVVMLLKSKLLDTGKQSNNKTQAHHQNTQLSKAFQPVVLHQPFHQ
jgi:hypothetical protein